MCEDYKASQQRDAFVAGRQLMVGSTGSVGVELGERATIDDVGDEIVGPSRVELLSSEAIERIISTMSGRQGTGSRRVARCIKIVPEIYDFQTEEERCNWLWDEIDTFTVADGTKLLYPPDEMIRNLGARYGADPVDLSACEGVLRDNHWPIVRGAYEVDRLLGRTRYAVMVFSIPAIGGFLHELEEDPGYEGDAHVVFALIESGHAELTRRKLEILYERFLLSHVADYARGFTDYMIRLWATIQNIEVPSPEERYAVETHDKPEIFGFCDQKHTLYFGLTKLPHFFETVTGGVSFPDATDWIRERPVGHDFSEHIYKICTKCGGRLLRWEHGNPCCSGISQEQIAAVKARFPTGPDPDVAHEILRLTRVDCTFARKINHTCSPVIRNASIGNSRPFSALTRIEGCPYAYDPGVQGRRVRHYMWSSFSKTRDHPTRAQVEAGWEMSFIAMVAQARMVQQNPLLGNYFTLRDAPDLPELLVQYVDEQVDMNAITLAITDPYKFPRSAASAAVIVQRTGVTEQRQILNFTAEYDRLVYPLLFTDPNSGFGKLPDDPKGFPGLRVMFKCFLFQPPEESFCHQSGLLMEELIADTYGRYFDSRLTYVYNRVRQMIREDEVGRDDNLRFGRRLFIPASVPGSKAYFHKLNYDAAALTLKLGNCSWFLTVTCNPRWLDLYSMGVADYALDSFSVARIFKLKVQQLMKILKSRSILGRITGYLYRYEYQNRGLPHVHILLWTDTDVDDPEIVNRYVTAELPPLNKDDESIERWRSLAQKYQEHHHSKRCGFPQTGKCCYHYPHDPVPFTVPYGRRMQLRRRKVEDANIVPYNPELLNLLRCNMDLEVVSSTQCPAYTLKYTSKDSSHSDIRTHTAKYHGKEVDDDIHYWMATKITGTAECVMDLLGCDRYGISPTVIMLSLHLQNRRVFIVDEDDPEPKPKGLSDIERYFRRPLDTIFDDVTMLQYYEQFAIGSRTNTYQDEGDLTHSNRLYVAPYDESNRKVARFKNYMPSSGELYYLKVLLTHIPARDYDSLYQYEDVRYDTYHQVAIARGLVPAEHDGIVCIKEAITMKLTPAAVRGMCAILIRDGYLHVSQLSRVNILAYLTQDIAEGQEPEHQMTILKQTLGSMVHDQGDDPGAYKLDYDGTEEPLQLEETAMPLSEEQQGVITGITRHLAQSKGALLYLQGRAGTGKTHTVRQLIRQLHENGLTVTPCGSTGIAASQYQGGQTIHKCFNFGVEDGVEDRGVFTSTVGRNTIHASRLLSTDLFIFDEASMITPDLLDRVDQTMRFIDDGGVHRFAGSNILLVGDFLQLPPVIANTRAPVMDRLLLTSDMWISVQAFALTRPMRCPDEIYHQFLTEVANGRLETFTRWSEVPGITVTYELEEAYRFILTRAPPNTPYPLDQLWIAGTNSVVNSINHILQHRRLVGTTTTDAIAWHTVDTPSSTDNTLTPNMALVYLDAYEDASMPPPKLTLAKHDPVFLLRNLDTKSGLVKGMRASIQDIAATGRFVTLTKKTGEDVTLPRICFRGKLNGAGFTRRQLPVRLAYAGTVHRSQGETLTRVVVDLRRSFWEHGQLYVALSRVRNPDGCMILLPRPETVPYDPDIISPVADRAVVEAVLAMEGHTD